MPRLNLVTEIAAPPQKVFDLARSVDLHIESMARSRERAIRGVTSGLIGLDEEVTWEARHFGIRWKMTSRITERSSVSFGVASSIFLEQDKGTVAQAEVVLINSGWAHQSSLIRTVHDCGGLALMLIFRSASCQ